MKEQIKRFLLGGDSFKKEFSEEVRLLVTFTLGFTIAFTWRQTFFDITEKIVATLTGLQSSTTLAVISSLSITIISLILIWIASRLLDNG